MAMSQFRKVDNKPVNKFSAFVNPEDSLLFSQTSTIGLNLGSNECGSNILTMFLKFHSFLNISSLLRSPFRLGFPTKLFHAFLTSSVRATSLAHLILFDLIIL
jgi:hypothetical protein